MAWDQWIFIAQLNVDHFRHVLEGELSGSHRRTVNALLEAEEAKLARLRSSVAENDLLAVLAALAATAADVLEASDQVACEHGKAQLALTFDRLPCAVGLINTAGELQLANDLMGRFLPRRIPSRDRDQVHRWHFTTEGGGRLNPFLWPSAKALRGEPVSPGIEGLYVSDTGEQIATRVASLPVWRDGKTSVIGAISAVYDKEALGQGDNDRTLERVLGEITPITANERQDRG